jgi:hypothetical protein
LQQNEFTGEVFSKLSSTILTVINIVNNLFTGTIPEAFFQSKPLQTFLAGSNCIDGTIPNSICDPQVNLTILDMTSIGGNPQCQCNLQANQHLPFFIRGTFSSLGLRGTNPRLCPIWRYRTIVCREVFLLPYKDSPSKPWIYLPIAWMAA